MRRIYLIDCPGIVYDTGDSENDIVLKGVVRAERLPDPTDFVPAIIERVKAEYLGRAYGVAEWTDHWNFMEQVAKKTGKLLKGGEPDFANVAIQMINDFQRGKLPHFVAPPLEDGETEESIEATMDFPPDKASEEMQGTEATDGAEESAISDVEQSDAEEQDDGDDDVENGEDESPKWEDLET